MPARTRVAADTVGRCSQAGVAWLTLDVATRPVLKPPRCAASRTEATGLPSSSTEIATWEMLIQNCMAPEINGRTSVVGFDPAAESGCGSGRVRDKGVGRLSAHGTDDLERWSAMRHTMRYWTRGAYKGISSELCGPGAVDRAHIVPDRDIISSKSLGSCPIAIGNNVYKVSGRGRRRGRDNHAS